MLSNNKTIDATIQYISQENDDETLLVLEIDKQIEEFTNYRKISFNLIWWSYSGLKVPNSAIVEQDGLKYVVRNINIWWINDKSRPKQSRMKCYNNITIILNNYYICKNYWQYAKKSRY